MSTSTRLNYKYRGGPCVRPHIIETRINMKNLIIDERIRKIEYDYLSKYFNIIKLPLSEDVYDEISGHSDIFYCNINNKIICAPNAKYINENFIKGNETVKEKYPEDIIYNVCQIGDSVIGSKYADSSIKVDVLVKQGYTKCSIAVTSDKSCITSDEKIAEILNEIGIDVLYIKEENINLLDRNGKKSSKKGFIGGASLIFDNKFVLFGDINNLKSKDLIINHIKKYNLELIDFKDIEIIDYGGGIIFD